MNQEDIERALNELRVLVLIECEDGKFRQVKMSPERFKRVSDATGHPVHMEGLKPDYEVYCHHYKEGWEMDADAFLGLSTVYEDADDCSGPDQE